MTNRAAAVELPVALARDLTRFTRVASERAYLDESALTAQDTLTARVIPQTWQTLGRAGYIELEQHILTVALTRREPENQAAKIDTDQQQAEAVRRYLADWHDSTSRVVEVTGPSTLDIEKLQSPGQVEILFDVDCDVLRNTRPVLAADEEPAPGVVELPTIDADTPLLTSARVAAWQAIDNWPALANVFARKYRLDDDLAELQLRDPAPHELPAIAVQWGPINPAWQTNRQQTWPMSLTAAIWCRADAHSLAEQLVEDVIEALYQAKPDDPANAPTYIHAALGAVPRQNGPINLRSVDLGRGGNQKALKVELAFVLRSNTDPFGES